MAALNLSRNLPDGDNLYADLLAAHEGLTKAQSDALNARLILIPVSYTHLTLPTKA